MVDSHDFAGGAHFGSEEDVDAGEFDEWQDDFFGGDVGGLWVFGDAEFVEGLAGHDARGNLGEGQAGGFADEWDGA